MCSSGEASRERASKRQIPVVERPLTEAGALMQNHLADPGGALVANATPR